MKIRKQRILFIILSISLILSMGCAITDIAKNKIENVVQENLPEIEEGIQDVISQAEQIGETAEETVNDAIEEQTGQESPFSSFELPFTITNNDQSMLDNYKVTFVMDVSGDYSEGGPYSQHIEMNQEVINEPFQMHEEIISSGSMEDMGVGTLHFYIKDDQTYMYYPDEDSIGCLAMSGGAEDFGDIDYLRPEDFFEDIEVTELVEKDVMVNGVLCDHYKANEIDMEMTTVYNQNADIWLAKEDGYIVRFTGEASGIMNDGEDSGDGTAKWEINVLDIGQVSSIEIPAECLEQQAVTEDIPVPDDVQDYESFAGIISYTSSMSVDDLAEYYRTNLPGNGWEISSDEAYGPMAMFSAGKGDNQIQIMITGEDEGGSSVIITTMPLE